jgi:hypothetical protein
LNYGGDYDQREYTNSWVPADTRIICNLDAAVSLRLHPKPYNGQRISVVDAGSNFATYNLTLDGNGRNIEGAATLVLSTDDTSSQWMYRADTGNWVKIETLETTDEMPFPSEFDEYFSTMLAMRLVPSYGQTLSTESREMLKRYRGLLQSRYTRRDLNMRTDPGLVPYDDAYGHNDFERGRYSPW